MPMFLVLDKSLATSFGLSTSRQFVKILNARLVTGDGNERRKRLAIPLNTIYADSEIGMISDMERQAKALRFWRSPRLLQTFARPLAPALADPKKCELPTKISGQRRTARGIDMYTAI